MSSTTYVFKNIIVLTTPWSPLIIFSRGELSRRAEATARALGIPLGEFVTKALEEKLAKQRRLSAKTWMECAGELAQLRRETRRIQLFIEKEFGVIEPADWK